MVMVMNNTGAFVLFLLLCAAWLSSARLLQPGAEVNNATSASIISVDATASTKGKPAILFDDENKSSKNMNVETSLSSSSSSSHYNEKRKRRLRMNWSNEVDRGFVAFSADYHGPRHHPPKNN